MALRPGVVTLGYPFVPSVAPEGFRGTPVWDHHKCVGCGGCAVNCSARTILFRDVCQEIRVMLYDGSRCTYCGRCAEVCPEKAITMSGRFEDATGTREDLETRMEVFMLTCKRCGRCFNQNEPNPLNKIHETGYRYDSIELRAFVPGVTREIDEALLEKTEQYHRPVK